MLNDSGAAPLSGRRRAAKNRVAVRNKRELRDVAPFIARIRKSMARRLLDQTRYARTRTSSAFSERNAASRLDIRFTIYRHSREEFDHA
jgi:hypothetical protein